MNYEALYELFVSSNMSYREFYDAFVTVNIPNLEFEAFRSAMRRRHVKDISEKESHYQPSEAALIETLKVNKDKVTAFIKSKLLEKDFIKGVFISDVHIPYTDWTALNLALQIIHDFDPDYITGLNDVFDFQEYGRWQDLRSPAARLWDSDIQNPLNAHGAYMRMLKDAAPNAVVEGIVGNHDSRMYRYLREQATSLSDWTTKHFIAELSKQGLVVSTLREEPRYLTGSLVLTHGTFATANVGTTAAKTVEAYGTKQYADESGKYYNTIAGHDHRVYVIPANGVTAYGNGCLCRTDMDYLKTPPNWQLGITLFYSNDNKTWAYPLIFQNESGYLTCISNEKVYRIKR